ncbi:hypothetical protein Q4561_11600 [Alteromonas sp. 1_MG-2023]|uniref:hypothetical protein n=1 Tax=Alteromonas sp. 1_MG-2023 TaxID=3062669 RepID=UPI0026E1E3B0|nr:hypothetical protein [Alteromonas sp. 1_MG-2023]MDO6567704.1 hypothetical protein [Alteromonas sp. 1_MG-2023]
MSEQPPSFHPVTKACAYFAAATFFFFGGILIIGSLVALPDLLQSLLELSKGVAVMYLAWSSWFAAKFSINPFTYSPFSMSNKLSRK